MICVTKRFSIGSGASEWPKKWRTRANAACQKAKTFKEMLTAVEGSTGRSFVIGEIGLEDERSTCFRLVDVCRKMSTYEFSPHRQTGIPWISLSIEHADKERSPQLVPPIQIGPISAFKQCQNRSWIGCSG